MKQKLFLLIFFLSSTLHLFAQDPLVGTWKLVSVTSTDQNGKTVTRDNSKINEMKIITPTHFIWIAETKGDSIKFGGAGGGTYVLDGDKYVETLTMASWYGYETTKTDFTVSRQGDTYIQKGTITFTNGQVGELNETWQKVKLPDQGTEVVGTWNRLKVDYTDENGKQATKNNSEEKQMLVLSPTHWMTITQDTRTKKIVSAAAGSYIKQGNKYLPSIELASWNHTTPNKIEVTFEVTGDKMVAKGTNLTQNVKWTDTYQKDNGKANKIALTK